MDDESAMSTAVERLPWIAARHRRAWIVAYRDFEVVATAYERTYRWAAFDRAVGGVARV